MNNSFVMGGKYFKEFGLELTNIYAPDTVFDCTTHDHLDLIGSNVGTATYNRERKLRVFLRELLSSDHFLGASIKMFFNHTLNAKRTIGHMVRAKDDSDYLIFQDMYSVRQFYKKFGNKTGKKTILILHCSNHPLEQTMAVFQGYYKHTRLKKKSLDRCDETMQMVDKVVYLSSHAKDTSVLPSDKKNFVFNGIEDLKGVKVVSPYSPLQLVCVGSVTKHKGQMIIVEALSCLDEETKKKLHFTIVGGGNEFEECRRLVGEKGLQQVVTMTGPRNDVAEILKGMDVFLLPSLSEGMPMSILEAMRQGLYIMATEVGGIPEMIEGEYGEFITRDPQSLSEAIKRVVLEKVVTLKGKRKSRERFEKDFTLRKMIERYSEILLSL